MKVAVLEKLLRIRQVIKLNELMDMSLQSNTLLKFSHLLMTNKKSYLWVKRKEEESCQLYFDIPLIDTS